MSFHAEFDASGGNVSLTKTLTPDTIFQIEFDYLLTTAAAASGITFSANWLSFGSGAESFYFHNDGGWVAQAGFTNTEFGTIVLDVWAQAQCLITFVSGTTWHVEFWIGGAHQDEGNIDLGFSDSDPFEFSIGAAGGAGGFPGEVYGIRNVIAQGVGSGTNPDFEEDFTTEDFSRWDGPPFSHFGSASIVDDGGDDPPPPVPTKRANPYRTVILNRADFRVLTMLDGLASSRQLTQMLRRPWQYSCTVPSDNPQVNIPHDDGFPFVEEGVRLGVVLRRGARVDAGPWIPVFGGELLNVQDRVDGDVPRTDLVFYDPRQWMTRRPVYIDDDGTFPLPVGYKFDPDTPGSVQAATLLARTITVDGPCLIDAGPDYGGTSDWEGTIEDTAAIPLTYSQGSMIGDGWDALEHTGSMDIVLKPIYDPRNRVGYLAELSILEQAGEDRNGVIFSWDKFPRNLVDIGRLKDGTKRATNIQFFDKNGTAAPPAVDVAAGTKYGVSWATQSWPGQSDEDALDSLSTLQLQLRKEGRTTVTITPANEAGPEPTVDYVPGDRGRVYASKRFRRTISGLQRIWGYVLAPTDDGVETVSQLLVSADTVGDG